MKAQAVLSDQRKRARSLWRSFKLSAWLGWQIESNWADPFLFAIYSVIKPLASVMILVVMYGVITRGKYGAPLFSYMYIGNAFYMYVGQVMAGISYAVIDDREHYKTLKYMYLAPIHIPTYLLGRGVARFLVCSISVFITMVVGIVFLQVRVSLSQVNWPLFFVSMLLGVIMLAMMGLILASVMLLLAHHMWGIGEAVAGALFLFSGAIFPLEALPPFLRFIGYLMPVTYWLELIRRSLIGQVAGAFPTLAHLTDAQLLGILIFLSLVFGFISVITFRWCDFRARERGLIDAVTNY
jgi:ABC-2 type transport system permease protein